MELKKWPLVFFSVLICSVLTIFLFEKHQRKKFVDQCEKLAMNWMHEQGLDESQDVDSEVYLKRQSAEFYDLENNGNSRLVLTIEQEPIPHDSGAYPSHTSSLYYFVFQKNKEISFSKIFSAGIWDGIVKRENLLKMKKGFPNLLCVYDGMSDSESGEGSEVKAHVFMVDGKSLKEVLSYKSFTFVPNAPPGYTSKISVGEGRNLVVDYSIPVRSPSHNYNVIGEKQKRVIYEWNEKFGKYILRKGSPTHIEPFFNEN